MPDLTPAKATVSAGLRAASRSLSMSGLAASATAAAMAGGTLWAQADAKKAGAQSRLVANRAALRGRIMAVNSCLKVRRAMAPLLGRLKPSIAHAKLRLTFP